MVAALKLHECIYGLRDVTVHATSRVNSDFMQLEWFTTFTLDSLIAQTIALHIHALTEAQVKGSSEQLLQNVMKSEN